MELERGFEIEFPAVFVPWGASEDELVSLLPRSPRRVTDGYHTFDCTALSGMVLTVGFHFDPRRDGTLRELGLFRVDPAPLSASFATFQRHLEATFGPPHASARKPNWYPSHEWSFGDVRIRHYAQLRFVQEDHVRIELVGRAHGGNAAH